MQRLLELKSASFHLSLVFGFQCMVCVYGYLLGKQNHYSSIAQSFHMFKGVLYNGHGLAKGSEQDGRTTVFILWAWTKGRRVYVLFNIFYDVRLRIRCDLLPNIYETHLLIVSVNFFFNQAIFSHPSPQLYLK